MIEEHPAGDGNLNGEGIQSAAMLTGDIVGSRKRSAADLRNLGELLREAVNSATEAFPSAGISTIDLFRGDSWQVLVRNRKDALRVALFIRTCMRGGEARNKPSWETRVGIGVGGVDWVDEEHISQSQGSAFVASGNALDSLSGSRRHMGLQLTAGEKKVFTEQAVISLLDALVQRWTSRQAWAVNRALRRLTQEEIGAAFVPQVGRRTAGDHLERADWDAVQTALGWWKEQL
ncbi:MAG: hypothetical protein WD490_01850 [Opitutales bacterium]